MKTFDVQRLKELITLYESGTIGEEFFSYELCLMVQECGWCKANGMRG